MGSYTTRSVKAKLPRRRKKAAIKEQGRQWYYATIKLYIACKKSGILIEPKCKFWVNASVKVRLNPPDISISLPAHLRTTP